ncbi:helix-turn-helix transcriptional regulator [Parasulfitobacter algicola]|uniref:LuxR family transcriptional regulator n=1 Tax=Parasulfitobacter algicola TaxID=2614809 RepID=A0ABX2ISC3_9RHOB|nr:LuxR family transcriptional regulator [Sulfitobacter algicola]NSX55803.1 LuxR family transcriptional regulator [Sulfitobacter algicola]
MMDRDYLEAVTEASAIEEIWALHTEKMAEYGFDRIMYGYTRFLTPSSLGDPEDLLVLTNHKSEYVDRFVNEGHYFHAPMMRWARENEGACSWSLIGQMFQSNVLTPSEKRVFEFNQEMGVTVGYSVSFQSVSIRSKGAIALTAKQGMTQDDIDAVWSKHGRDIVIMNNVAHLKIINMPYFGVRRTLTKRQREALEWVGDGKTTQDIAEIMGLTAATIEKHLRLAREALDVETTAQAVLKANMQNQIFILEA